MKVIWRAKYVGSVSIGPKEFRLYERKVVVTSGVSVVNCAVGPILAC